MTMVDRVGHAIAAAIAAWQSDDAHALRMMGRQTLGEMEAAYRASLARAAIEAMREPTTAMHDRAAAVINRDGSMDKAWKAAIAAALAEG